MPGSSFCKSICAIYKRIKKSCPRERATPMKAMGFQQMELALLTSDHHLACLKEVGRACRISAYRPNDVLHKKENTCAVQASHLSERLSLWRHYNLADCV